MADSVSGTQSKAELMKNWRKEKEEKRKASRKAYYQRNQKELIAKAVERKQKAQDRTARGQRETRQVADRTTKKSTSRVQRYRLKEAAKSEKQKAQSRERSKRHREKRKTENEKETEPTTTTEDVGAVFKSRMAKKRAVDKTKQALPATPSKKVAVVENIVQSPRTRKVLEKRGLMKSPEEEKEMVALKAIVSDLSSGIGALKRDNRKESRAAYGAVKAAALGKQVKGKRAASAAAKILSVDRRVASRGIKRRLELEDKDFEEGWLQTKRKHRADSISEEVKLSVHQFWDSVVSRPTADRKDVIRKRIGPKQYTEHAKHVLEQTQTEAYFSFCAANPDVKISQRKFEYLKPYYVKSARERDRRSCLCRKHEELRMVLNDCARFRKNALRLNPEREDGAVPLPFSVSEVVETTLCPKPEGSDFHKLSCIDRKCSECGTKLLDLLPEEIAEEGTVKWKRYDYAFTGKQTAAGEPQKKLALVQKETCPKELFEYLLKLLQEFPYHQFMAIWQRKQLDKLLEHLPVGHVVCIHDYSESYSCRGQNETQTEFFDVNKATLHITVMFRHAALEYDGVESTEEEPVLIKEHIFAISEDPVQDYNSVHHCQMLIARYLKEDVKAHVARIHEFTDGCAAQYKSRHCIGDLSCSLADFGFLIYRNFFETSHAKGEQDAAGSHVKQQASLAVLRGRAIIKTAKDLCSHLSTHFSKPVQSAFPSRTKSVSLKRRLYFFIPTEGPDAIPRNRGRKFGTLNGIRKLHSIITTPQQCNVLVRYRSCYCGECLNECYDQCENKELVDELEKITLQREASGATTRGGDEEPLDDNIHLHVADLVGKNSVVAIAADEDDTYDYYLFKVTSDGPVVLDNEEVDSDGSVFTRGSFVLKGHFFFRDNLIDMTYKLKLQKVYYVYPGTVRYVCSELVEKGRGRNKVFKVPMDVHEDIIASL